MTKFEVFLAKFGILACVDYIIEFSFNLFLEKWAMVWIYGCCYNPYSNSNVLDILNNNYPGWKWLALGHKIIYWIWIAWVVDVKHLYLKYVRKGILWLK